MEQMPTREYECEEGSPAAEMLETLGVFLVQGRRVVRLDPILMAALLALQGKVVPVVSNLITRWKKEDEVRKEEHEEKNDQPDPE
jgi:hypothetical protein